MPMLMRVLPLVLLLALALMQYPLWFGKAGWLRVWEMEAQVSAQQDLNDGLRLRNAALEAEVRDLQNGTDAIEERARQELGLVSDGELFVQIVEGAAPAGAVPAPPMPAAR